MWYIYIYIYIYINNGIVISYLKKNEVMPLAAIWMVLDIITVSQRTNGITYM